MSKQERIERACWSKDHKELTFIREQVFIIEQHVPRALELDGEDELACHWLAFDRQGQPVATVRMLKDGHIGRLAVLLDYRGTGYASALLEAVIEYAQRKQFFSVYLHAQTHAIGLYQQFGFEAKGKEFMDAGIAHRAMHKPLTDQRLLGQHSGNFSVEKLSETAFELISQAQRQIHIVSYALDPDIFSTQQMVSALSKLARKSRYTAIRVLVVDTHSLIQREHELIELSRRLSSSVSVRRIDTTHQELNQAYIVADDSGFIQHDLRTHDKSLANFNNRPVAQSLITDFNGLWAHACDDVALRRLSL